MDTLDIKVYVEGIEIDYSDINIIWSLDQIPICTVYSKDLLNVNLKASVKYGKITLLEGHIRNVIRSHQYNVYEIHHMCDILREQYCFHDGKLVYKIETLDADKFVEDLLQGTGFKIHPSTERINQTFKEIHVPALNKLALIYKIVNELAGKHIIWTDAYTMWYGDVFGSINLGPYIYETIRVNQAGIKSIQVISGRTGKAVGVSQNIPIGDKLVWVVNHLGSEDEIKQYLQTFLDSIPTYWYTYVCTHDCLNEFPIHGKLYNGLIVDRVRVMTDRIEISTRQDTNKKLLQLSQGLATKY